jgi:hypothetical protein
MRHVRRLLRGGHFPSPGRLAPPPFQLRDRRGSREDWVHARSAWLGSTKRREYAPSRGMCQREDWARQGVIVLRLPAGCPERTSPVAPAIVPLREKGSSLNSAFLTPKPLASSVYVHVPEAPSPLKRSISVMSFFSSSWRSIRSAHSCCARKRRARRRASAA